jgi:hypothetical protein
MDEPVLVRFHMSVRQLDCRHAIRVSRKIEEIERPFLFRSYIIT